MSIWNLFDGGVSMPCNRTPGQRFTLWVGRRLALRHEHVFIDRTCLVHPDARTHPRDGEIRLGVRTTVAAGAMIQGNVSIGENSSVQAYTILVGYGSRENPDGRITIGNNVRIASHVMVIAANHIFDDPARPIHEQGLRASPVVIEDDVWIAGRVNIMAGVTIGRGSVIGAGAVVTKDIPPMSIAVGSPARVIKRRVKSDEGLES